MENKTLEERIMRTITSSSPYLFNSAETEPIAMIALSEKKALIAFNDEGNRHLGTAIIATIDRDIITYSPKYVFSKAGAWSISVTALSETQVLIAYAEGLMSLVAVVLATISDDEIVYSPSHMFSSGSIYYQVIIALSSTTALIVFADEDNQQQGTAIVATISGDTISFSQKHVFSQTYTRRISAAALSSNQVLIAFSDVLYFDSSATILATVSENDVSFSSQQIYASEGANYISVSALSENQVLLAYKDSVSDHGTVILTTISGDEIVYSSQYVFNKAYTSFITVTRLSETQALITFEDGGDDFSGKAVIVTAAGDTISTSKEHVFSKAGAGNIAAVPLSKTNVLIAYAAGGEEYGTAVLVTVSGRDTRKNKKTASLKVKRKRK